MMMTVRQKLIIDLVEALKEEDIADSVWAGEMAITLAAVVQNTLGLTNDMMELPYTLQQQLMA